MGDRLPANCGVRTSGNKFVISYKVGKNVDKKGITWTWKQVEGGQYVASMEAKAKNGDVKYHNSAPIAGEVQSELGKPETSMDDDYFKVKLKKGSRDISEYFEVPQ